MKYGASGKMVHGKIFLKKILHLPVVNLLSHVDSLAQLEIDKKFITNSNC